MLRFTRGHNIISKYLICALKNYPTSTTHIKLYFLRILKQKYYMTLAAKKQHSEAPIPNEIVIYENNDSKFFLRLSILSVSTYICWILFGVSTYKTVSAIPEDASPEYGWYANARNRQLLKTVLIASFVLGTLWVPVIWLFILRNIKTIILRNESKQVVFDTFTPFHSTRRLVVPLNQVSGVVSRQKVKGYVPLKIGNKPFYFLVDVNGIFRNHSLFDSSICLKRKIKA